MVKVCKRRKQKKTNGTLCIIVYIYIYRLYMVPCQQCCPLHTDSFVGSVFVAFLRQLGLDTPYL